MIDLLPFEVKQNDRRILDQIGRLRVRAWAIDFPEILELDCWLDRFDDIARHWIVMRGGEIAAAARLTIHGQLSDVPESEGFVGLASELVPTPIASINRLVVDPACRGLRLSRQLDEVRLQAAELAQCRSVVGETHSRSRIRQLTDLGFEVVGIGKPHQEWSFLRGLVPTLLVCKLPRGGDRIC